MKLISRDSGHGAVMVQFITNCTVIENASLVDRPGTHCRIHKDN